MKNSDGTASASTDSRLGNRHATVILTLLFFGYLLSFADRVIFSLAIKPIKESLQLSDSQIGLLSGLIFAASYALFSPIGGYLADRMSRRSLMAAAVAFWSAATVATGLAASFISMGIARAMVGVGESMLHPLAVSLLSDAVDAPKRSRSFGVYMSAGATGALVALLGGGLLLRRLHSAGEISLPLIGTIAPWQALFFGAGVPGFILAAAIILVMKEPLRRSDASGAISAKNQGAIDFLKRNWRFSTAIFVGISTLQMGAYTLSTWYIVFFERVHGLPGFKAAILLACTSGVATLVGCIAGGRMISRLRQAGRKDAALIIGMGAGAVFMVFSVLALLATNATLALAILPIATFCGYIPSIAGFTAMGEGLPSSVRARLAGLHTLANGIISNSLGPFLVGFFSDTVFAFEAGIRYSLIVTILIGGCAGIYLLNQGRSSHRALVQAQESLGSN